MSEEAKNQQMKSNIIITTTTIITMHTRYASFTGITTFIYFTNFHGQCLRDI